MQLLGINKQHALYFLILIACTHCCSAANARSTAICDSTKHEDLVLCAESRYKESDSELNTIYRRAVTSLNRDTTDQLRSTQRQWILFRDAQCGPRGNTEDFGAEAPIERLICLSSLTKDRVGEIKRILGSKESSAYYTVINSLLKSGFGSSPSEIRNRLAETSNEDPLWNDYVDQNCEIMNRISGEDIIDCKARMNLFRTD